MIELLENLEVLKAPLVGPEGLALAGVGFGSKARDFPVDRVVEVALAPIVKQESHSREHGHTYRDATGHELSLAEVIEDVLAHGGVLHFREKVSFKIKDGAVTGLSIYGSHLDAFQYIRSQDHLVREFGEPDSVETNEAHGDVMGYFNFWSASQKLVAWDDWKKRIYVVNFGMKRAR
jgi:hypothetical protein